MFANSWDLWLDTTKNSPHNFHGSNTFSACTVDRTFQHNGLYFLPWLKLKNVTRVSICMLFREQHLEMAGSQMD